MHRFPNFSARALPLLAVLGMFVLLTGCTPSTDSFNSTMVDRESAEYKRDADTGRYFYLTTGRKAPTGENTGEYQDKEEIQYAVKKEEPTKEN